MTIWRGAGGGGNATTDSEVAILAAYQADAAASAAAASTSETNAAASESNASTSATNSANSATAAATSETNAASSASAAATSETNAANSATEASNSAASIDPATLVKLTGDQTIAGVKTFSSTISGSVDGNAATATTAGNVTGTVAIANGGTGATTAAAARTALGSGASGDAVFVSATAAEGRTALGFTSPVIDRAYAEYTANANLATQIPIDDTLPQNTEGTQILSVSLTPKSATNRVRLRFQAQVTSDTAAVNAIAAIFSSASVNALRAEFVSLATNGNGYVLCLEHEYVPGTTSALTYTVRVGPASAVNLRLNGNAVGRLLGGAIGATLIVEEIAA